MTTTPTPAPPALPPVTVEEIKAWFDKAERIVPVVATFVPQLNVVLVAQPLVDGLLDLGIAIEHAGTNPAALGAAIMAELQSLQAQLPGLLSKFIHQQSPQGAASAVSLQGTMPPRTC